MSKARQRRETFYKQGFDDAKSGGHFRWRYHPHKKHYQDGWRDGRKQRGESLIQRLKRKLRMI